jgi:hypothetical protein
MAAGYSAVDEKISCRDRRSIVGCRFDVTGRVEGWRHTRRSGLSVAPRFLWECLINRTVARFHPPPCRTERADFPHSALLLASQESL